MANHRALDAAKQDEAKRLLAAGVSARKIAQRFGVDHKTITKLGRGDGPYESTRAPRPHPPASEAQAPSDDFEAAQLRTYEILRASLEGGDHDARGLSQIAKALNDTIKAIRQHRIHSGAAADAPEASDMVADMVIARMIRLAARSPEVPPASVEVVADSDNIETGT